MPSNFEFLRDEWPALFESAVRCEVAVRSDPRAACFYARLTLESAAFWLYEVEGSLQLPYESTLNAMLHEPTFKTLVPTPVFYKAKQVKDLGNKAAHKGRSPSPQDSMMAVKDLFHVMYWVAANYSRQQRPEGGLQFDEALVPTVRLVGAKSLAELQEAAKKAAEDRAALDQARGDNAALAEELERLKVEVATAKAAAAATPDTHDYSEAETRDHFIDLLLNEAGWPLDQKHDREFKVTGMPGGKDGFVDYVLWGDDGKPLGLVEAKRTKRSLEAGKQQAKLYADCLEAQFGQRPVIFLSNGYEHQIWDDVFYPPREVQGFYKKSELDLLVQRRATRKSLATTVVDPVIAGRHYQTRAIRRIGETFETDRQRRALLVMATGAGKTRTVIGLSDVLLRANWAKRILFLADRTALVNQASNAFMQHLPDVAPVNLLTDKNSEGRVFLSTYPTMMGLIEAGAAGERRFGVGHFDLVVIDEAHRSVFRKYGAILDYFDAMLVGLTATPKDEVDRSTYSLFNLESGVPTDAYGLDEAVIEGYLVPPVALSVPLKFQREGISYDDLSDDEKDQWDALEWDEELGGEIPDRVDANSVNKWFFNQDTVDKVLANLMTDGHKVAGGDMLAKTIIFAKNQKHAEFIAERFDANYPNLRGRFARIITHSVDYAGTLIDDFSDPNKDPRIAISVDMLDTGIDVPDVANLVFFKIVRSKTKFWQMIGRGTRLRPDLYGPGRDKTDFRVFDYCGNFDFFGEFPEITEPSMPISLQERLFGMRVDLLGVLDEQGEPSSQSGIPVDGRSEPATNFDVRRDTAALLHRQVRAMNVNNMIVRPRRRVVEKYADPKAWQTLTEADRAELLTEVAGLPDELPTEQEQSKRFDALMLRLELALLTSDPGFLTWKERVTTVAGMLEEKEAIPMVKAQMEYIQAVQTDEWWQDVTLADLERTRRHLRDLVVFIEAKRRIPVYTDFEDEIGPATQIPIDGLGPIHPGAVTAQFRSKTQAFLREHDDHVAVNKLRRGIPLTQTDLDELARILTENGIGDADEINLAAQAAGGLGVFVRSLVGLDREAAKQAMSEFLTNSTLTSSQIEFVNMIVDYLTARGFMDAELLYASPFIDVAPQGPEAIFTGDQVDRIVSILDEVRRSAEVA